MRLWSDNSNIKLIAVMVVILMSVWVWLDVSVAALPHAEPTSIGPHLESTMTKNVDHAPLLTRSKPQ